MVDDGRRTTDGRRTDDGRTTEHGYTISSPCEPDGSGELKMPTILTLISMINYRLWQAEPEISTNFGYFINYEQTEFHAQLS